MSLALSLFTFMHLHIQPRTNILSGLLSVALYVSFCELVHTHARMYSTRTHTHTHLVSLSLVSHLSVHLYTLVHTCIQHGIRTHTHTHTHTPLISLSLAFCISSWAIVYTPTRLRISASHNSPADLLLCSLSVQSSRLTASVSDIRLILSASSRFLTT